MLGGWWRSLMSDIGKGQLKLSEGGIEESAILKIKGLEDLLCISFPTSSQCPEFFELFLETTIMALKPVSCDHVT